MTKTMQEWQAWMGRLLQVQYWTDDSALSVQIAADVALINRATDMQPAGVPITIAVMVQSIPQITHPHEALSA